MGEVLPPQPAKLIVSIFAQRTPLFKTIENLLSQKFGPIDFRSHLIDFEQTHYYDEEFGSNLKRKLISFEKLIKSESLWKIKVTTNALEKRFTKNNKRQINIDPGYLTQANLILASTKMFFHRIHMNKGIYQEVTMIYQDKMFKSFPWTYPDYQTKECTEILLKMRDMLRRQLKEK